MVQNLYFRMLPVILKYILTINVHGNESFTKNKYHENCLRDTLLNWNITKLR